jgi:hypothetical protein
MMNRARCASGRLDVGRREPGAKHRRRRVSHVHRRVGDAIAASRRSGQPFRTQFEMRRKDGLVIWIDLYGTALAPDSDESMGVFVDITALKRESTEPPSR